MLHNGAPDIIFGRAKALRKSMTAAEKVLWLRIRDKRFLGLKFRRQHPFGRFIFDFFCHELKIAMEVDGEIHNKSDQKKYDAWRTEIVAESGVKIFRLDNCAVLERLESVLSEIKSEIPPLLQERGARRAG
ncbi:MAG: endonuclease domain-containing protein [Spirochaetes bacterium]|nr:endonuclease domain-containing protein [Spirochaetota bacterium]